MPVTIEDLLQLAANRSRVLLVIVLHQTDAAGVYKVVRRPVAGADEADFLVHQELRMVHPRVRYPSLNFVGDRRLEKLHVDIAVTFQILQGVQRAQVRDDVLSRVIPVADYDAHIDASADRGVSQSVVDHRPESADSFGG